MLSILAAITIVTNIGFTVAYDGDLKQTSWAHYTLCPSNIVKAERKPFKFAADPRIEATKDQPKFWEEYKYPRFDRGHMAPAADFNWNEAALKQTYLYSNIVPMLDKVNRGRWAEIEREVRDLASKGEVNVLTYVIPHRGWYCAVGPEYAPNVPTTLVKVAWGWFGIKEWRVLNK